MFRKLLDEGVAGDNVGVLLRGTKREEVERDKYAFLVLSNPIQNLNAKYMSFQKMKVEDIRHSLVTTDRNFISEQLM